MDDARWPHASAMRRPVRKPLSETVFLVSGGGRGVTADCVTALARAGARGFVLLGRTPLDDGLPTFTSDGNDATLKGEIAAYLRNRGDQPTPVHIQRLFKAVTSDAAIRRTLRAVTEAGALVEYHAADVTDAAGIGAALATSTLGPVTGIIHGAGVLSDKLIQDKTLQDFDAVYATKIHGLRAMLANVDVSRLSYLTLFSSVASVYGNRGQSDYAAANEVLNKFAHAFKQRVPSCHTTVFNWGPWDGGMVTPQLKAMFASRGVPVIDVNQGTRVFVDTLTRDNDAVQVLVSHTPLTPTDIRPWRGPVERISRSVRLSDNPFLRDHIINGKPVLPAACAGAWMANTCQQARPGYRFFSLSDFRVLKGLVFDDGLAERYVLEMQESELGDDELTLAVRISSTTSDHKVRYHYSGRVRLVRTTPASPSIAPLDTTSPPATLTPAAYGERGLFHGPTFQVIRRVVTVQPDSITVECQHPEPSPGTMGQFPALAFDPVCQDAQFQSIGLWAAHVQQASAFPSRCEQFEFFAHPPTGQPFYISTTIDQNTTHAVRATVYVHDGRGRVFSVARGAELTFLTKAAQPAATPERSSDRTAVLRTLRDLGRTAFIVKTGRTNDVTSDVRRAEDARSAGTLLATLPPVAPSQLGSAAFRQAHQVKYAYMAGAMAKGIASEDLVIALGKAGLLGSFGAGGLSLSRIEAAVVRVKAALPTQPFAFNLLHSPRKLRTEDATVDVYLKHGVRTVEASSYIGLTPSIVRYRVAGLRQCGDGSVAIDHKVIVKLSRVELAAQFMQPSPPALVQQLLDAGSITPVQAALAARVPLADDITVEADSGGHTDNRPLVALLPAMLALRDDIQRQRQYPSPLRVGAAGGIATPHAALAAFMMGADYVVTGSVNQGCVEAGTSAHVKRLLATVDMADVAMAPESDMFEQGVRVQVLKQGSLFPMRAQKLYDVYQRYEALEAIPEAERRQLERQIFRDSLDNIWMQAAGYLEAHKPEQLARAADPKVKLALLFKWYLGQTSRWAAEGHDDRQLDYQIWCGPAMGAFNSWARGTYLESPENRRVADVARVIMSEAACLYRLQMLNIHGGGIL